MIGRNGPIRIEAVYLQPFSLHLIGKITHQSDQILHRIAYHKDSEQIGYIVGYSIQDDLYRIPDVVMLLQLLLTVPLLFSIFPQTKSLAYTLFSYIKSVTISVLSK